ncbi:farnesyl pyrophosphate synthase-like [Pogonomyrmex barbatus]|uniref:Farnesyl pyrophosphate synthase n=1 Tax=Pogonomyrmex barbatus TaxID=144034 RepID=A0A6I9WJT6_9HYME|nr:farnesyl pyrophosphate synthase-like [Pogonomyrmex barbatus]
MQMARSVIKTVRSTNEEEIHEMMALWPSIVHDITESISLNIPDVTLWMKKVLQYNVPNGKKVRSLALIYAYKSLASDDQLTEDNVRLVRILAWCIELLQAYLLIIDDIQDRSLFRRGQPCWYRHNDIGLIAINDGLMLEQAMFYIIRKHFNTKECYINILETFQDVIYKTLMGQCLDLLSSNFDKKPNVDFFTLDRYNSIVEYKTSYYTFILPVTAAIHLVGIKDPEMFRQTKLILLDMGRLFQAQDDYLACYGDYEAFGKDNTDIQEGKCTWLVVTALDRATSEQRKILRECYGFSDPEKVRRVKQLFIDMNLPNIYLTYEEQTYNLLIGRIRQMSCELLRNLFLDLLEEIYHRKS